MDLYEAGKERYLQLNELEELRQQAYENSSIHKERTKAWHDRRIRMKEFKGGPFEVIKGYPSGHVKLRGNSGGSFIVNGKRVKHYYEEDIYEDGGIEIGPYAVD
uniref:uncharacterized protein LOC122591238 n=1 Tax=Erigeron canadensis TaxID=72917 RepID=UPI001CB91440|nr:uncharacterized protein LOC122591238 [Erigeron canadensis]